MTIQLDSVRPAGALHLTFLRRLFSALFRQSPPARAPRPALGSRCRNHVFL